MISSQFDGDYQKLSENVLDIFQSNLDFRLGKMISRQFDGDYQKLSEMC